MSGTGTLPACSTIECFGIIHRLRRKQKGEGGSMVSARDYLQGDGVDTPMVICGSFLGHVSTNYPPESSKFLDLC